jgi:dTDP-4-dehydrorhamnose 3,5-epimerase
MKLTELEIPGAFMIDPEPIEDERGFFARSFCRREFEARGLNGCVAQCNISFNRSRGTLRGMHYQAPPHPEAKLVRCSQGAIYDVIVDVRPGSPTYGRWTAVELTAASHRMLHIPEGLAHGFQTLEENTEVFYQMSEFYDPACARGLRWDDPAFNIRWPLPISAISEKDRSYPSFALERR